MLDMFRLDDQIAIVTGGASGIGYSAAMGLAETGAKVAIFDRDLAQAREAANSIEGAFPVEVDISDESAVDAAVATVLDTGLPSVLVNCAGVAIRNDAVALDLDDWEKVVKVNMTGSFLTSRAVARALIAAGKPGSIIQTASIMGLVGGGIYPNVSYQTTKGAIVNMTRSLAVEWAGHGIRVNAVAPTYVRTPFISALMDQPEIMERILAATPLGRLAEPEEVAAAILFLASPAASMVTGHCLAVDGGYLAQ